MLFEFPSAIPVDDVAENSKRHCHCRSFGWAISAQPSRIQNELDLIADLIATLLETNAA